MAILDDTGLPDAAGGIEIVNRPGLRSITHVLHDVDGTHSLIREWPPVMSAVLKYAMTCGLGEDFDAPEQVTRVLERLEDEPEPELLRFCEESAGLSSLTQMEFGIRHAVLQGNVPDRLGLQLTADQQALNSEIIDRIWAGEERFDEFDEPSELLAFIHERAPRLFRFYEDVLHRACRDRNTDAARRDPDAWRVPGSIEFLRHLRECGCVNYFITGSVLRQTGGMTEEVEVLGYEIGPGKLVERMVGASAKRKTPKDEVMRELVATLSVDPTACLVIGDGRSEIGAGVGMGCVAMSRLPVDAHRQRGLHRALGTHYIVADFTAPALKEMIRKE